MAGRPPSELYGLTCRHVAHKILGKDPVSAPFWLADDEGYAAADAQDAERRFMMTPGNDKWPYNEGKLRVFEKAAREKEQNLRRKEMKSLCEPERFTFDSIDEATLSSVRQQLQYCERLLAFIDEDVMGPAVIGHIAFMSPIGPTQPGFLRDWALIRLDNAKLNPLPANKVFVDREWGYRVPSELYNRKEQSIKLQGVASWKRVTDRKAIAVVKRGRQDRRSPLALRTKLRLLFGCQQKEATPR